MFTIIATLWFFVGLFVSRIVRRIWKNQRRKKIARDQGCGSAPSAQQRDPIFGLNFLDQLFQPLKNSRRNVSMKTLFDVYGHTFQVKSWSRTKVFCIEPKNIQSVLATDSANWGVEPLRLFAFGPFVGKGIMCSDGAFWEHSRALIKPTFARTQIADLHLSMFDAHVQRVIALIPRDGSTTDLQPLFARLALDSSTEFLFGDSVGSLSPETVTENSQNFLNAYNYGQMIVGRRFQLPHWNILTWDRKFWSSCKVAHRFVEKQVSKASLELKKSDRHSQDLGRLILAHQLVDGTESIEDVRNQLLNVFLPAHEATGVALTNVFFHLARNPLVYSKLRKEVVEIGSDGQPWTFERLKSLRYLQNIISEAFRLNPTIGTLIRIALRDTLLPTGGGLPSSKKPLFVNKGDIVTFSLYALHRRTDIFGEDADTFRPERWETLRPPHWSYLPFSGGSRICPGQSLALTEVAYATARILQAFQTIENRDPVLEFIEVYKLTTDSKNGAKVAFVEG